MSSERQLHTSHWGAFEAEVAGRRRRRRPPLPRTTRIPRPCWATSPGVSATGRASPSPWSAPAGSTAGRDRTAAAGAEPFVPVSWATAIDLLSRELRRVYDAARRRGGLRRLLRLGERRPLPPRAEPAPSLPQLPRRLRARGAQLQQRRSDRDHAPRRGRHARLPGPGDRLVGDRAPHGALRLLRRHPAQEHDGEPRRGEPASPPGPSPRDEGPRGGVRAAEPDARRPARVPRGRVAPGRAGHRRRRDARPRPHPGRRGALRSRVPRAVLRGLRPLRGLPPRRGGRRGQDARVGRAALRDPGRDDPDAGAPDGREADADQRELVAPARRARRAGSLDGRDARGDAGPDRAPRRRVRQRVRLARLRRPAAAPQPSSRPAPAAESGARRHPVRPPGGHAAPAGRALRLRRPAARLPRHPPRLLVRREPVPPPPGPRRVFAAPSPPRTRSSSTTRSGRRWRATPTSCSRRP